MDVDAVDGAGAGELSAARVMFYSHDTYGLGHLRRTLALVNFLAARRWVSQLVVTGSPLAHRFALPEGSDYVKLPSVVKVGAGMYECRSLRLPFRAIRDLRTELLLGAARHFRPTLLVVDNVPGGLKRELEPTLRYLKSSSCRLVLGLRDIIDEAERVRTAWTQDGSYHLLDEAYDRILVYGAPEVYDPVAEYGFSADAAAKTRFTGYLGRGASAHGREQLRAALGLGEQPLVLVMAGGGEDGYELLRTAAEAVRLRRASFQCLLLGGPLLPAERAQELQALARGRFLRWIDFVEDVSSMVGAADAVVSMGGYNSVCELLSVGKPGLIVPRVAPRREQLIRAEQLSRRGCVRMLHPAELTSGRLRAEIDRLLEERPIPAPLPLGGLAEAAAALDELLGDEAEAVPLLVAGGRVA